MEMSLFLTGVVEAFEEGLFRGQPVEQEVMSALAEPGRILYLPLRVSFCALAWKSCCQHFMAVTGFWWQLPLSIPIFEQLGSSSGCSLREGPGLGPGLEGVWLWTFVASSPSKSVLRDSCDEWSAWICGFFKLKETPPPPHCWQKMVCLWGRLPVRRGF